MNNPSLPSFKNKPNDNATLWRYLSLERFIDLLITQELHFARVDQLGDHFEGMWTTKDYESLKSKVGEQLVKPWAQFLHMPRRHMAVSCWHENERESAAMWSLYNPSNDGVAIVVKFYILRSEILSQLKTDTHITFFDIARVKYLDHLSDNIHDTTSRSFNIYDAPMCKNSSYIHENEVRALISNKIGYDDLPETGYKIKIDVNNLIDKIIVNPAAPNRIHNILSSILNKYGYNTKLFKSSLSKATFEELYEKIDSSNVKVITSSEMFRDLFK